MRKKTNNEDIFMITSTIKNILSRYNLDSQQLEQIILSCFSDKFEIILETKEKKKKKKKNEDLQG